MLSRRGGDGRIASRLEHLSAPRRPPDRDAVVARPAAPGACHIARSALPRSTGTLQFVAWLPQHARHFTQEEPVSALEAAQRRSRPVLLRAVRTGRAAPTPDRSASPRRGTCRRLEAPPPGRARSPETSGHQPILLIVSRAFWQRLAWSAAASPESTMADARARFSRPHRRPAAAADAPARKCRLRRRAMPGRRAGR